MTFQKKRKMNILILLLIMALSLSSCGEKKEKKEEISDISRGNIITLYHSDGYKIVKGIDYLLKQPDSFNASIEEVVNAMKTDENVEISSYEPDEYNNLLLVVNDLTDHTPEEILLAEASLVNTFSQISGMGKITISMTNDKAEEVSKNTFTRDSFFYYNTADEYMNTAEITFYVPNKNGRKLKRVVDNVKIENGDSPEMAMLRYLKKEGVFSEDTEIISVFTRGGVCYINFSKEFQDKEGDLSDEIALYSIVDSLTNIKGINSVRIYIDGDETGLFRGRIDISGMLNFEGGLIE
ncbi:MAG: GerMN domain-containing protein [Eubacterium sp.]|nr:GerMN domain-containing protein [Eubacterium sp.]SEF92714.1 Sporulation and spore germination [Eubacterium ruminantium]